MSIVANFPLYVTRFTVFGRLKYKYVESYYYIKLKNGNYITKDKNYINEI